MEQAALAATAFLSSLIVIAGITLQALKRSRHPQPQPRPGKLGPCWPDDMGCMWSDDTRGY